MSMSAMTAKAYTAVTGIIPNPTPEAPPGSEPILTVLNWVSWIAIILAVITAAEVVMFYVEDSVGQLLIPILVAVAPWRQKREASRPVSRPRTRPRFGRVRRAGRARRRYPRSSTCRPRCWPPRGAGRPATTRPRRCVRP